MSDLVERLEARATFEDARVLEEAKRQGFVPEVYNGSQTGDLLRQAAAALSAVREAPVVKVRQVEATFGHGDHGCYWVIGSSYDPPPDWVRTAQKIRIAPVSHDTEEG